MAAIIDRTSLADFVQSEAVLLAEASHNEEAIDAAVAVGNNDVLAALRRSGRYDQVVIDAITVANSSPVLKGIACAIARDELTGGNSARPDLIGIIAAQARSKLSLIATSNYAIEGLVLSLTPTAPPSSKVEEKRFTADHFETLGRMEIPE